MQRLAKTKTSRLKYTCEFILGSIGKGNALSSKSVDTSSGDDGEGHGMAGEIGRSDHARESLDDIAIGRNVLRVGAEKLI